jgi:iron-sulfur cluster assembly accessory protein
MHKAQALEVAQKWAAEDDRPVQGRHSRALFRRLGGLNKAKDAILELAMNTETAAPVTVSARAAKRIAEILRAEPQPAVLRVAVTGGGCSGFQYNFVLENDKLADDLVIERDGATVLVDPVSLDFLKGAEIDFVDDLIGAAFKVNNPNATSSCGCGTSFSV